MKKRHIDSKHAAKLASKKPNQRQLTDFAEILVPSRPISRNRNEEVSRAINEFVIKTINPASVLNEASFQNLIHVFLTVHKCADPNEVYKVID